MIYHNDLYNEDLHNLSRLDLSWEKLKDKSVLITGARGMICSFLIDLLMYKNRTDDLNVTIYALGRNSEKAKKRFMNYFGDEKFVFIEQDINNNFGFDYSVDYIIHGASNSHPLAYSTDPVGTIMTNVAGTKNVFDYAVSRGVDRVVLLSTVEIYGENKGDVEAFDERYCGYIDCNTLRAGYSEGKRAAEALCQAYIAEYGIDIAIARLCRVYGPTMLKGDSKAVSQFVRNAVNGKNIVLKSKGEQLFSYVYVADAVSGILTVLLEGETGEAYNVSDSDSDIYLKELAQLLAGISNTQVVFRLPGEVEAKGFSKATKAVLNSSKLQLLGWKALYSIEDGVKKTVQILKNEK